MSTCSLLSVDMLRGMLRLQHPSRPQQQQRAHAAISISRCAVCCALAQVFRQLCIGSRLTRTLLPGPELEARIAGECHELAMLMHCQTRLPHRTAPWQAQEHGLLRRTMPATPGRGCFCLFVPVDW